MVAPDSGGFDRRQFNKAFALSVILSSANGKLGPAFCPEAGSILAGSKPAELSLSPAKVAESCERHASAKLLRASRSGNAAGKALVEGIRDWLGNARTPNSVFSRDAISEASYREALANYLNEELAAFPESDCFLVNLPMRVAASFFLENQVRAELRSTNGHPLVRQRSRMGGIEQIAPAIRRLFEALPFEAGSESKDCATSSPIELVSLDRLREKLTPSGVYEGEHASRLYVAHHPLANREQEAMESSGRVPAADLHCPVRGVFEIPHAVIGIVHGEGNDCYIEERFLTMTETGNLICLSEACIPSKDFKRQQPTVVQVLLDEVGRKPRWLDELSKT